MTELGPTCAPGLSRMRSTRQPAYLTHDRSPLDRVDQHRGALDRGCGGFHARQRDGHADDDQDERNGIEGLSQSLSFQNRGIAGNIGHREASEGQSLCHIRSPVKYFVCWRSEALALMWPRCAVR